MYDVPKAVVGSLNPGGAMDPTYCTASSDTAPRYIPMYMGPAGQQQQGSGGGNSGGMSAGIRHPKPIMIDPSIPLDRQE